MRLGHLTSAVESQEEAASAVVPLRAQRPDLYLGMHVNLVGFGPARAVATARELAGEVPLPPRLGPAPRG